MRLLATGGMSMNQPSSLGLAGYEHVGVSAPTDPRVTSVLRRSPLFDGLSHAVGTLSPRSSVVKLQRKSILYAQGSPADAVFVIASGRLRISRSAADRTLTVAYRGGGDLVGETALLGAGVYHDAATATDGVEAISVPIDALKRLMSVEATFAERMLQLMAERRVDAERRIEGLLVRTVESRVASFIADAARRHGIPDSRGVLIGVKYTHQEIGDYVGSTRETVTLTLGELRRRGFISFDHRRVLVIDNDGLARIAC